jgi:hypothetical protein
VATLSTRYRFILAAAVLCATVSLPACYTIFVHPRLAELNYQRPTERRCEVCHSSQELWDYTHPATIRPMQDPWGEYYEMPWWFPPQRKPRVGERPGGVAPADSVPRAKGER